jgi:hypothetical protein
MICYKFNTYTQVVCRIVHCEVSEMQNPSVNIIGVMLQNALLSGKFWTPSPDLANSKNLTVSKTRGKPTTGELAGRKRKGSCPMSYVS